MRRFGVVIDSFIGILKTVVFCGHAGNLVLVLVGIHIGRRNGGDYETSISKSEGT
jgi:hypothetical protein